MKKLAMVFGMIILISCEKENAAPTNPVDDDFDPSTSTLLKEGTFENVVHKVSGIASLYDNSVKKVVVLDPFMTENGPDLKVYLSVDENASSYIKLGELKSTTGKQSYEVPDGTDVSPHMYVHIWCEAFTVNFGQAKIE